MSYVYPYCLDFLLCVIAGLPFFIVKMTLIRRFSIYEKKFTELFLEGAKDMFDYVPL
jgi:hypothetical protein